VIGPVRPLPTEALIVSDRSFGAPRIPSSPSHEEMVEPPLNSTSTFAAVGPVLGWRIKSENASAVSLKPTIEHIEISFCNAIPLRVVSEDELVSRDQMKHRPST